jgi:hypothetical protein
MTGRNPKVTATAKLTYDAAGNERARATTPWGFCCCFLSKINAVIATLFASEYADFRALIEPLPG